MYQLASDQSGHNPSPRITIRLAGLVIAFFAINYVLRHTALKLREDPFQGKTLLQTKAVIFAMNPGVSRTSFRQRPGFIFQFHFAVDQKEYEGDFFARSDQYYKVGHEITVEYVANAPEVNRLKVSPGRDGPPDSIDVMGYVFMAIYAALGIVGLIMLCTGRDFLKRR
jgi:hypothetical protein